MKTIHVKITNEMLQDFLHKYEDAEPDDTERFGMLLALDELERLRKITADIPLDRLTEICQAEREQQQRRVGCEFCDKGYYRNLKGSAYDTDIYPFCPNCGRRLEESQ